MRCDLCVIIIINDGDKDGNSASEVFTLTRKPRQLDL